MFYTQVYIKCDNELRGKINNQRREGWATERLGSSLEVTTWVVKKSCAAWLQGSHPTFEHSTECFQLGHLKKCYESHSQDRLKDRKEEQTDDGRWGRVNVTLHSWVPWRQWVSWRLGEISNKLRQCQLSKQCFKTVNQSIEFTPQISTETKTQLSYLLGSNVLSPGVLFMLYSLAHHFSI